MWYDIELPHCHGFLLKTFHRRKRIGMSEPARHVLERLGQLTIATHVQKTLINSKQSLKTEIMSRSGGWAL
jgi:hypothetical protein